MKNIPKVAVVLESSHPISREMILGIIDYVRMHTPWSLSLIQGGPSDLCLPRADMWRGTGIIARVPTQRLAGDIASRQIPTVMIDPEPFCLVQDSGLSKCSYLSCDSESVGRLAADFFLERGYTSFAYVRARPDLDWSKRRERAFCLRVHEVGYSCSVFDNKISSVDIEMHKLGLWLKNLPVGTAVFTANDVTARDVLNVALVSGVVVPDDIAVLGVNNDEIVCETSFPRLSSIRVDARRAGKVAASMLAHQMRDPNVERRIGSFSPIEVVERESAGIRCVSDSVVTDALKIIQAESCTGIRVGEIAMRLGLTVRTLENHMNSARVSLRKEIERRRLAAVDKMLRESGSPVAEIARKCGYASVPHLSAAYRKRFGMTMGEARGRVRL